MGFDEWRWIDSEFTCILALGKIALLIIMENGLNGRRNGRRIANYHLLWESCSTNQVKHENQDELTLNQIRKWYKGGVKNGRIKNIDNIKQDEW